VDRNASTTVAGLKPGDTVTVQGKKEKGGTVKATSISDTEKGVTSPDSEVAEHSHRTVRRGTSAALEGSVQWRRGKRRVTRPLRRDLFQRVIIGFAPAAILVWLGIDEASDALRGGVLLAASPSWPIAVEVVREILYGYSCWLRAVSSRPEESMSAYGRARVVVAH